MKEVAVRIKSEMDTGHTMANIGKYSGQYQFLGRLEKPIAVLDDNPDTIRNFAESNPDPVFISYKHEISELPEGASVRFIHEYRGRNVMLWEMNPGRP